MSCKCAKMSYDPFGYYCTITGDRCMYFIPDSQACARDYGEGPDADEMEEE